jgi:hypothetical protein
MAIKPYAGYGDPLPKFAQSSLKPIGGALSAKPIKYEPDPLPHFSNSSLAVPGVPAGTFKPFKPLPGGITVGGPLGFPT